MSGLAAPVATCAAPTLRIVTYNIHRCIGRDRRYLPARIGRVLGETGGDLLALQEVPLPPEPGPSCVQEIVGAIGTPGWQWIARPTCWIDGYPVGNAVISRHPLLLRREHDLRVARREPRAALEVGVALPSGQDLRVIATHLGLRPFERRLQIEQLIAAFAHARRERPRDATVLLGDFNEWLSWARPMRWLARQFPSAAPVATFPSGRPFLALDRIWLRPRQPGFRPTRHASALARIASDHLPLVATIDLPLLAPGGAGARPAADASPPVQR
ncbi:MAG: endonuclease/exonuclease/phosphatase family protein [Lautropia sp.]